MRDCGKGGTIRHVMNGRAGRVALLSGSSLLVLIDGIFTLWFPGS